MIITTQHKGVTIEGRILEFSANDFVIEITSPYQDLTDGRHLPDYARGKDAFAEDAKEDNALGPLKRLYRTRHFLEQNKTAILRNYQKLKNDPDFLPHKGEAQFLAKRRDLRTQLNSFAITHSEFEEKIERAEFQRDYLKFQHDAKLKEFLGNHFPMAISDDLWPQLFSIMEEWLDQIPNS